MSHAVPARTFPACLWLGAGTLGLMCLLGGCSQSEPEASKKPGPQFEVATDTDPQAAAKGGSAAEATATPGQPPSLSVQDLDTVSVPDGSPEELLNYANQVGDQILALQAEAAGQPQSVVRGRLIEYLQAILAASDKVLASSEANVTQRKSAVDNKAGAMSMLSQLEPEKNWQESVRQFATTLSTDAEPEIAITGKSILFGLFLGEFAQGQNSDVAELVRRLEGLLQEESRTDIVMGVALQAMNTLLQRGNDQEARKVLDMIVAAFQDSQNPDLAAETLRLREQAQFMDAGLDPKFQELVAQREGAPEAFEAALATILQANPGMLTLEKGGRYIGMLQQTGQYAMAKRLCELYAAAYAQNPNEELKQRAAALTQMALRRLNLVGQSLTVEGQTDSAESLDFNQFQGKVVLVLFFGAFDPRCQQELMVLKQAYDKYHAQGFDVVGVSVDPDREVLQQFLDQAELPWKTVVNSQFAQQCGADMLPFGVLLGRDGKVVDIFVQGPSLGTKLEKVLGIAPDTAPPASLPVAPPADPS